MNNYFNDDQIEYMNDLASDPTKVCGCGWYTKEDCWSYCVTPSKQRPEESSVHKRIVLERERCAMECDKWVKDHYKVKEGDEFRKSMRYAGESLARIIRNKR